MVVTTFISLIAPFGGFFAKAMKKAQKIKDFGDIMPGHGGLVDKMDCHPLVGVFVYFFLSQYVFKSVNLVESAANMLRLLDTESKLKIYQHLQNELAVNATYALM